MRRFQWRLQRLLDVTAQKENAARNELAALADRIARLARAVAEEKARLREVLADLAEQCIEDRFLHQPMLAACLRHRQARMDRIAAERDECERVKQEKTHELIRLRNSRQTLERMRDEARQRYLRDEAAREQRQLDEAAQVAFARSAIQDRRDRTTGASQ